MQQWKIRNFISQITYYYSRKTFIYLLHFVKEKLIQTLQNKVKKTTPNSLIFTEKLHFLYNHLCSKCACI